MDIETAARLVDYRKKFGYSQEELAEKIGVSRQAISKWERSESSPDTDNLIALAKLYNISIDELLNGANEAEPAVQAQETPAETEEDDGNALINGIIFSVGIIAFIITGFLFKWWAFGWTFILFGICGMTLVEAIKSKKPDRFGYPIFVAAVYCLIGMTMRLWHPTWVLFITIPVYYTICEIVKRKKKD